MNDERSSRLLDRVRKLPWKLIFAVLAIGAILLVGAVLALNAVELPCGAVTLLLDFSIFA